MDFHIYLHTQDDKTATTLSQILLQLQKLTAKETVMAQDLTALTAEVQNNTTVSQSAIALIQGIKAQLDAAIAANDPAALQALSDSLAANDKALSDAVTANTPAAPTAPTGPTAPTA